MGKALLVLLLTLWAVPSNAAEVLAIGDGDTLAAQKAANPSKCAFACIHAPETSQSPYGIINNTTSNKGSVSGWF